MSDSSDCGDALLADLFEVRLSFVSRSQPTMLDELLLDQLDSRIGPQLDDLRTDLGLPRGVVDHAVASLMMSGSLMVGQDDRIYLSDRAKRERSRADTVVDERTELIIVARDLKLSTKLNRLVHSGCELNDLRIRRDVERPFPSWALDNLSFKEPGTMISADDNYLGSVNLASPFATHATEFRLSNRWKSSLGGRRMKAEPRSENDEDLPRRRRQRNPAFRRYGATNVQALDFTDYLFRYIPSIRVGIVEGGVEIDLVEHAVETGGTGFVARVPLRVGQTPLVQILSRPEERSGGSLLVHSSSLVRSILGFVLAVTPLDSQLSREVERSELLSVTEADDQWELQIFGADEASFGVESWQLYGGSEPGSPQVRYRRIVPDDADGRSGTDGSSDRAS